MTSVLAAVPVSWPALKVNGVMVSVSGQLELHYEAFDELVDPETLVTKVRYIETGSDFHSLARFLETEVNE